MDNNHLVKMCDAELIEYKNTVEKDIARYNNLQLAKKVSL